MPLLQHLFDNNRAWAAAIQRQHPDFFQKLSQQQKPRYLWIGCSDSRVPANEITGLLPGEMFVHRNVANIVIHTDFNCLSVIEFAVEVLQVEHIIVCGHYGCGGVQAAFMNSRLGLIDNWLRHIRDVHVQHATFLASISDQEKLLRRLAEFNVIEQVLHVCQTTTVQNAWQRLQPLSVHGWIYDIRDGLLRNLEVAISAPDEVQGIYQTAVKKVAAKG